MNEEMRETLRVKIDERTRRRMDATHYCPACQRWLDQQSFYDRVDGYLSGNCRACSQAKLKRRAVLNICYLREAA